MTIREPCDYLNCTATAERDWLLAEATDEVRDYFFAIRAAETARILALAPIVVVLLSPEALKTNDDTNKGDNSND